MKIFYILYKSYPYEPMELIEGHSDILEGLRARDRLNTEAGTNCHVLIVSTLR